MADNTEDIQPDFRAASGSQPIPDPDPANFSFSSPDGRKIYLNFYDPDSTALSPSTGTHLRFSVTKTNAGLPVTVYPTSTAINSTAPKTVILNLSSADRIVDGFYNSAGVVTSIQYVSVNYSVSAYGSTVPYLGDNDTTRSLVDSFSGFAISNLTSEANGPVIVSARSSYDGNKLTILFRESSYPLLPYTGISGFAVSQTGIGITVTSAYVLDPTSPTDSKRVVMNLATPLEIDTGSNPVTVSYSIPTANFLTDSSPVRTKAPSFSGFSVLNQTDETTKPTIISAETDNGGIGKTVYLTMSERTLPNSPSGFLIYKNNSSVSFASTASTTSYLSTIVTKYTFGFIGTTFNSEDQITLNYVKPTSNFVYDLSLNANPLDTLSSIFYVTNLVNDVVAPSLIQASSYVEKNGFNIYLKFSEYANPPLLPSTDITGFKVFVNGVYSPIKKAISINTFDKNNFVKLSLYTKIHKNDVVTVGYQQDSPTTAYSLRDSVNNYVASFEPVSINNNTSDNPEGFFDPLEWNSEINLGLSGSGNSGSGSIGSFANGDDFFDSFQEIFSKQERYPGASVILDTHPPYGTVMFNRNEKSDDPGIKIHEFAAFGDIIDYSTITDYNLSHLLQGWKYESNADQTLAQVSFKLKKQGTIANSADKIEFLLYANDEPGTLVGKIGEIIYADLTDTYKTFTFTPTTELKLTGSSPYWFVISLSSLPMSNSGTASVFSAQITKTDGIIAYYNSTTAKWIKTLGVSGYTKVSSSNITGDALSGRDILLDILENPIREAITFGGSSDESLYEIIGDNQHNYILKKLNKILDASGSLVYPTVINIVVGASSSMPKNYSIEIKENPNDEWKSVFDTISDEDTYEFINYKFDTPKQLSYIRLSYRGDYFTVDTKGTLTLAVRDDLSDVVSAQVSHFSDFRDAIEFENSDVRGLFDFIKGVQDYLNYNITNSAALWQGQDTFGSSEGLAGIQYGSKIIFAANNKVYVYQDTIKQVFSVLDLLSTTDQVTCFAVFKDKLYLGTSNGYIYSSYNGEFWSLVNAKDPLNPGSYKAIKPIKTMTTLGKYLFIGTTQGTTLYSSVYSFDGRSLVNIKDFEVAEITSSASFANYVYFGMGDGYGNESSSIYKFNNSEWTKILSSTSDSIDALVYSKVANSIVAGFSGGQIWKLPFDSNNDATSWSLWHETYADNFYSLTNDTGGNYLYAATTNGVYGYFKSQSQFKLITSYKSNTPGLNAVCKGFSTFALGLSDSKADMMEYNKIKYNSLSSINYSNFLSSEFSDISSTGKNAVITGYIKAEFAGSYAFQVETGLPIKLYLNDNLVIDQFTESATVEYFDATETFTVAADELIRFKAVVSYSTLLADYRFKLYWNYLDGEDGYQIVPSSQYYRANEIKSVWNNLTSFVGIGIDGNVYEFDPSFYETKVRNVYARFRDEAGNIHGIVLPGKTNAYPVIKDKITQDLKTSNGLKVSSGKIFQLKQNDNMMLSTRAIYTPRLSSYSIYAPDRKVRASGYWEAQPFYVPSLSQWGNLTALVLNKYGLNDLDGLDAGTEVKIYIKSSTSRDNVLGASYGEPYVISYVNNSNVPVTLESFNIPLKTFGGKWLQYKVELSSATKNLSPELYAVTITYTAATGSYFYSKMFDSSDYSPDVLAPKFRRGLLTSNDLPNGGTITYGYTTDDTDANTYDFSKYIEVIPNKTFELSTPSSKIRFAIMFTAVGATPSVVYDWAVQLDAGSADLKMMPGL